MKKIVTNTGLYGPFDNVTIDDEAYICDGALLPFSVVGIGSISDWTGDLPTIELVAAPVQVPESIDAANALIILYRAGMLDAVKTAVAQYPVEAQILFERKSTWQRNNPILKEIATAAGIPDSDLDQFFIEASKL